MVLQYVEQWIYFIQIWCSSKEELIKKYDYPNFDYHKDQHNKIIEELFHIYKKHKKGEKEVANNTAFLFGYWLNTHVQKIKNLESFSMAGV